MTEEEFYNVLKKDYDLTFQILAKNSSWLRFLVTTASVLFGVLVSLYGKTDNVIQSYFFSAGIVLLALSILIFGISLYAEIYSLKAEKETRRIEAEKSHWEDRSPKTVFVPNKKIFSVCEITGYICFSLAILALCGYILCPILACH